MSKQINLEIGKEYYCTLPKSFLNSEVPVIKRIVERYHCKLAVVTRLCNSGKITITDPVGYIICRRGGINIDRACLSIPCTCGLDLLMEHGCLCEGG